MKATAGSTIITQLAASAGGKSTANDKREHPTFKCAISALMLMIQIGLIDGWFSPNMARLTQTNSTLTLSPAQASWLASWLKLGRFTSVLLVPLFIELAGTRKAIICTFLPITLSWSLTIFAKSALCLYVARFLSGLGIGLTFATYSIYLGEIAVPRLRGTFNSIAMLGWPLGVLASTLAETYLPEDLSCAIYLLLCFLGMFLFTWLPESPYQLVKNRDLAKARRSLAWYRGHKSTEMEMAEIVAFVESTGGATISELLKQLSSRPVLRALALVTLVFTYPQLSGVFNVIFYMEIILSRGKSRLFSPSEMVIFTSVVLLLVNVAACSLVDKLGRRVVLVVSSALMTAALVGLGLHFYLLDRNPGVNTDGLPVVAITILLVTYSIGFAPATGTLLGEMFPASAKSSAATVASFFSSFAGFATTKSYEPLVEAIGETYVFWVYAAIAASAVPVVMFLLPETKGKSLQEIQKDLQRR